jgi:hypothetical protein
MAVGADDEVVERALEASERRRGWTEETAIVTR